MVNASILPFEPASAATAPQRPMSPTSGGRGFDGAMDDALGTRGTRRDDGPARPPRRADPARQRDASDSKVAAPARKAANPGQAVSAKKAERTDEEDPKAVDRDDEPSGDSCAPADAPAQPAKEAKTDADGAAQSPAAPGEAGDAQVTAAVETAAPVTAPAGDVSAAAGEDATAPAADRMARGRRWQDLGEQPPVELGKAARTAVTRAVAGAAVPAATRAGHAVAGGPQGQLPVAGGSSLPEAPHAAAVAARADAAANPIANGAATAVETAAAKPQTASVADATAVIENAVANVAEAVAAVETAAGDAGGTDTHEQAQPKPQPPAAQTNTSETVAVTGLSDGMKFTVNSAAGNAAYTNATPRHEEAVLPQIVQSIRLNAAQGATEARVQLRPEHLGALNITLKVEHNQVTATIQADVAAVRAWIESHESSLRQALSEQGLQLTKLVVQPDDQQQASKDEPDGERPRRQSRRRSWRDEEATFEVLA